MILCDYGCGSESKYKLPSGKSCCSDKHTKCPSFQSKITYAKKIDTDEMCSYGCGNKAGYLFKSSGKFCCSERLQSCPKIKKRNSEKNKIKQLGERNAMFGKKHTKEAIEKNRRSNKKLWEDPNSFFNSKEWKLRLGRSLNRRPNYPEEQILNFLNKKLPGRFLYTGDFSFWVGRKNPDFVNKKERKIIEFFGNKFHEKKEEKERKKYFKRHGYETLVIWEVDFRLKKKEVYKKILNFGGSYEK